MTIPEMLSKYNNRFITKFDDSNDNYHNCIYDTHKQIFILKLRDLRTILLLPNRLDDYLSKERNDKINNILGDDK